MRSCKSPRESHYTITKKHLIHHHTWQLRYPKRNPSTECITELSTSKLKIEAKPGFLKANILISKYFVSTLRKNTFMGKHMKSRDKKK